MTLLEKFIDQIHSTPAMFFNTVKYVGDHNAMLYKEDDTWKHMTYNQYGDIVTKFGSGLIKLGIAKGDCIALMAHTSPAWAWCDMGIQTAGGITVCVYPTLSTDETIHICNNSSSRILFAGDAATAQRILDVINEIPSLDLVICMQKDYNGNGKNLIGLNDLLKMGQDLTMEKPEAYVDRWQSVQGNDGCTIIYTSGTTGLLKGVYYNHQIWLDGMTSRMEKMVAGGFPNDTSMVTFTVLPLAHVWERLGTFMAGMATGSCLGFVESPATIVRDLQIIRPTWVQMVPRLWSRMLTGIERAFCSSEEGKQLYDWAVEVGLQSIDYHTDSNGGVDLRPLINGNWSDALPEDLAAQWKKADEMVYSKVRNFFGGRVMIPFSGASRTPIDLHRKLVTLTIPLHNGWGLTETTGGVAHDNPARIKFGYNNTMAPGALLSVQPDGELWVKGRGIALSYFNDPENTSLSWEDGWFKTGDIGEVDDEGYVRITDRKKAIIVLDTGKKVAPARIEEIICRSLLIDQMVVTGDDRPSITALVVPAFDNLIALLESKSVPVNKDGFVYENLNGIEMCTRVPQEFINIPIVKQIIDMEITNANRQLDDYETIRKYTILNHRFSEEEGELTPTQKVKANFVVKKYSDIIDTMY